MTPVPALPQTARFSHRGRRKRNEDSIAVVAVGDGLLVAVADGMGGHASGEVASAAAVHGLLTEVVGRRPLGDAARTVNRAVYALACAEDFQSGMGTTLVAGYITATSYEVVNVGDSRAYRITSDGIHQVTQDHSFVAEAIRSGELSAADASNSRWKNALTRAVGTDAEVEPDVFGPFIVGEPQVLLFCSDGLYKALADELIGDVVRRTPDIGTAVNALASLAHRRGSDDNISVVAVEWGPLPRVEPGITLPLSIERQQEQVEREKDRDSAGGDDVRQRHVSRWRLAAVIAAVVLVLSVLGYFIVRREVANRGTEVPLARDSIAVRGSLPSLPSADTGDAAAKRRSLGAPMGRADSAPARDGSLPRDTTPGPR